MNLKKLFVRLVVPFLFCSYLAAGQVQNIRAISVDPAKALSEDGIDTTDIPRIKNLIDTSSTHISAYAAVFLAQRGYTGIDSSIVRRYSQSLSDLWIGFSTDFLYALFLENYPGISQMVHEFIDTMVVRRNQRRGPYEDINQALRILLNLGDYSRFSDYAKIVDAPIPNLFEVDEELLMAFGKNPALRDSVYKRLKYLAINSPEEPVRASSVLDLHQFIDKPETRTLLYTVASSDSSMHIRQWAINILTKDLHDPAGSLFSKRAALTTNDSLEFGLNLMDLEYDVRSPVGLKFLEDIRDSLPQGAFKDEATVTVKVYKPPKPPKAEELTVTLDSLMSFMYQVAGYNWLSNQNFVNELDSNLSNARNYLLSGDSNNCARQIKIFQQKVDEEYRDSLDGDTKRVTIEGWKFLYYNAQYILARLPAPPAQFMLTVNINGSGIVAKNPDIVLYDSAATVTLTATGTNHNHFVNWSGGKTGNLNPDTVRVTSNRSVAANFAIDTIIITVSAGSNGSMNPLGSVKVTYGANQSFTITPNTGYNIDSIIVNGIYKGTMSSYTFNNVRGDSTIRAVFKIKTYTITATAGTNGTITPGTVSINHDANQSFTITPNTGYNIDSVIVNGMYKGTMSSYTFNNVRGDSTIRAVFKIKTYTLTPTITNGGTISPSSTITVNHGTSQRFTFSQSANYRLDSVIVDGVKVDSTSGYTFSNATANHTIKVKFKRTYQITVLTSPPGRIDSVDGIAYSNVQSFAWDSASTHRIATKSPQLLGTGIQYTFSNWTDNGTIGHTVPATSNTTYIARFNVSVTDSVILNWNMLSVPAVVSNFSSASVYSVATNPVYAYAPTGYVAKDTLKNGPGYWVKVGGNTPTVNYSGGSVDSVFVSVDLGWNMIGSVSYPIGKSNIRNDSIIVSSMFEYKSSGYVASDTLKPGKGYWIKTKQAGQLVLGKIDSAVSAITPVQPPPPPGAPLAPVLYLPINDAKNQSITPPLFWYASEGATSYRLQVSTSSNFSSLTYDNASITTTSQQIGGLAYSTIYYWRVNASNQFGASNWSGIRWFTTQAPPPPCECCLSSTTSLDAFMFTDAAGNSQQLFVRNGNRPLRLGFTDVEMPPKPIAGLFHARFASNKFIETAPVKKSTQLKITVNDAKGVVKLSWNVLPENNTKYWLIRSGQPKVALTGTGNMDVMTSSSGTIIITTQAEPPPCEQ